MTRVLDLTMPVGPGTRVYPGDPGFEAEAYAVHSRDGFYARRVCMPEHIGTHVDAPLHFAPGGLDAARLPLWRLIAPAWAAALPRGGGAAGWGEVSGALGGCGARLAPGEWLVLATRGRVLAASVAEALVSLGAAGLAVDSMSPDDEPYPVHRVLLPAGVPILENLVVPGELLCRRFTLVVAPLPLLGGSGAPARVYAVLDGGRLGDEAQEGLRGGEG